MPTPATVTRRPRIRRLFFVARSCAPQSSSGFADARLSRLVMAGRSHRLRPRPGVEIVDMILDKATVAAENRAFTGAPQPLQQAAGELQIGCRLVGVEVGRAAFRAVRPGNIIVAIHVVRPSLRGDGIAPSLSSEARRVGKECVSTFISRWLP